MNKRTLDSTDGTSKLRIHLEFRTTEAAAVEAAIERRKKTTETTTATATTTTRRNGDYEGKEKNTKRA
jgi:hypothetical protein